jgi:hypothetical protein
MAFYNAGFQPGAQQLAFAPGCWNQTWTQDQEVAPQVIFMPWNFRSA